MELSRREFAKMIAAATVVPPTVVPRFLMGVESPGDKFQDSHCRTTANRNMTRAFMEVTSLARMRSSTGTHLSRKYRPRTIQGLTYSKAFCQKRDPAR